MKFKALLFAITLSLFSSLGYGQTLLPNFYRTFLSGSTIPTQTAMTIAPDGRIFICEQAGKLWIYTNGALLTTPAIALSVQSTGERGLIGIALDPDFSTNNYLYLYYTTTINGIHNRISRFTMAGNVISPASESILLELTTLSGATNHNGGAMAFGLDGKLYVCIGENANTANSQNLDHYFGKMLRINKDGSAPTDNPFYNISASEPRKRIWAYGLRNPFTFSIQPVTGKIFINDVGGNGINKREEINDASSGGRNFGWPISEGYTTVSGHTSPFFAYASVGSITSPFGNAITGGTFYNPTSAVFPSSLVGKYFFMDYTNGWIYYVDPTGPAQQTAIMLGTALGNNTLALTTSNDGNLYYLRRTDNKIYKISYVAPASAPSIVQQPYNASVEVGGSNTFSVVASGTAPINYQWQKNGINILSANGQNFTLSNVTTLDGGNYRVVVNNAAGTITSNIVTFEVTIPNVAPVVSILSPLKIPQPYYSAGDVLSLSGMAIDSEDGTLTGVNLNWYVRFHHDVHYHDQPAISGTNKISVSIPREGEVSDNVWYRIILEATDSKGKKSVDSLDILPNKTPINLFTQPSGMKITLDGTLQNDGYTVLGVNGVQREIGVYSPQTFNGKVYEFISWSNGGSAIQTITTSSVNTTYTATYKISQTVSITGITNVTLNGTVFNTTINGASSSGLPVSYSILTNPANIATITGNVLKMSKVGTITLSGVQLGDVNYAPSPTVITVINVLTTSGGILTPTLDDSNFKKEVIVYPNPNNGSFTVFAPESSTFEIYSLEGILMQVGNISKESNTVVTNLRKGFYFLRINNINQKLIIQ